MRNYLFSLYCLNWNQIQRLLWADTWHVKRHIKLIDHCLFRRFSGGLSNQVHPFIAFLIFSLYTAYEKVHLFGRLHILYWGELEETISRYHAWLYTYIALSLGLHPQLGFYYSSTAYDHTNIF